jgi:hypothetical protein
MQHRSGYNANPGQPGSTMARGASPSGRASLPTPNSTKAFWHSEPSDILLGHRTTISLPTTADIVIIGSGMCGASAAFHLHKRFGSENLDVVMLEAREACWGATGRVRILLSFNYPLF